MTRTGYKLFRMKKDGRLYPLFVLADKPTPMFQWLEAEAGVLVGKKVKSKIGLLSYRPGWHLCDIPEATHLSMTPNRVWAECEYEEHGSYRFKTNPRMNGEWIIAKRIRVMQVLTPAQVEALVGSNG